MDNLTTAAQIRILCRPITANFKDTVIETYIPEAEQIDIKPILGEQMYIDLSEAQTGTTLTAGQIIILDGGVYTVDSRKYVFGGLKKAIAYFVYARLIRNIDNNLTSFGFVNKELNESSRPELKEKLNAANDAMATGNVYLNEVLQFIKLNNLDTFYPCSEHRVRRTTINAIGD